MFEEATIAFIKEVGVPITAFIMMYALYVQNQKWQQKQQEKTEARFDNLVSCFTSSIKEITEAHNKAMERHTEALERNTARVEEHTAKLHDHIRVKDEFMEYIKDERRTHG